MRRKCFIIIPIVSIIYMILCNFNTTMAAGLDAIYGGVTGGFYNGAAIILGVIKWGGTAILVGSVIVKGIKYVSVSPEGKAEIKKEMVMLSIGALILFSSTTLINIVYSLTKSAGL